MVGQQVVHGAAQGLIHRVDVRQQLRRVRIGLVPLVDAAGNHRLAQGVLGSGRHAPAHSVEGTAKRLVHAGGHIVAPTVRQLL